MLATSSYLSPTKAADWLSCFCMQKTQGYSSLAFPFCIQNDIFSCVQKDGTHVRATHLFLFSATC